MQTDIAWGRAILFECNMRIMSNNAFLACNLLLGFAVNLIAFGSLVLGFVELKPGWGPFSKPLPVITLLYVALVLGWFWLGVALINWIKRRYQIDRERVLNPTTRWKETFHVLMYVVTAPTTVLWILAWIELMGMYPPGRFVDDTSAMLGLLSAATFLGGGWAIGEVVLAVDWFLNPDHYNDKP